jgi:hypothetical protein
MPHWEDRRSPSSWQCNTGVLSLRGDNLKSFECDKEAIDHASMIQVPSSVSEILEAAKELSLNKGSMPSKKQN